MKKYNVILCFLLIIIMCGCSSFNKKSIDINNTPELYVENALKALKGLDLKTFNKYVIEENDGKLTKQNTKLLKEMFQNFDYVIVDSSINGETAIVNVNITNTDFSKVVSEFINNSVENTGNSDNNGNNDLLLNLLKDANKTEEKTTVELELSLKIVDNVWKINLDDKVINILSGNILN